MARTLNPTLHSVRRDAFLEGAQRLIETKGYEAMSVHSPRVCSTSPRPRTHLFIARQAKTIPFELVERTFAGFTQAFERILGIPPGSLTLQDRATLDLWFG